MFIFYHFFMKIKTIDKFRGRISLFLKSIDVNSVDVLIEMSIIGFILYNLSYFIVFIKYLWKISKVK
ncbi:hypothetical protein CN899_23085 [Bacillus thuringiensis]|uniref:Uncharacterized protein n=1 Tax=Bacillus thuringiensis TaxID=1428 RepID=A0A9X7GHH7_BACTU|nr:hypothetical protein CN899_23085 [Bacillus thuringiensis]